MHIPLDTAGAGPPEEPPGPVTSTPPAPATPTASPPEPEAVEEPEAGEEPEARPGTGPEVPLRGILEVVGLVVAPTSLATALLFYFGWARARATYEHFGIDHSALGFTLQDYLVRSVGTTFEPLVLVMLLVLGGLWAHGALARTLRSDPHPRPYDRVWAVAVALGGLLLAIGLTGMLGWVLYRVRFPLVPVSLGGGLALVLYGASLRGRPARAAPARLRGLRLALAGTLIVVTLFWTVSSSAEASGAQHGRRIAVTLWRMPDATVYSAQRLQLAGPGVREERLGGTDAAYRFRTTGLKLLVRAGGKWFLLPACWTRETGAAILLPDRDDLRVELDPGAGPVRWTDPSTR
jgi:hypothetical protein